MLDTSAAPLTTHQPDRSRSTMAALKLTPYERVMARCVRQGGCLVWQGARTSNGYGQIAISRRTVRVHRLVYEHCIGPIPDGLTIDHVAARGCTSRACCEISHLQAVTRGENALRGTGPTAANATKTHCPQGHELTGDNLRRSALLRRSRRECNICRNSFERRRYRNKVAQKSQGLA
jgi:hypothetical protein